jgi:hypothetical protein
MSNKELCERDLSILNLILDETKCEKFVEDATSFANDETDAKDEVEENTKEILHSKALEVEGVELTEAAKLEEALEKFNKSIEISRNRPSPYNNRAQLYRFMEKDDRKNSVNFNFEKLPSSFISSRIRRLIKSNRTFWR